MTAFRHIALFLGLLFFLSASAGHGAAAKKKFRWVDKHGVTHYTDYIPPEASKQERCTLNAQGVCIERVKRAKTEDEVAVEQELARLRAEQARLVKEQEDRDTMILRTFASEQDLLRARDSQVGSIDIIVQIRYSNIARLQGRLHDTQREAADRERSGKKVKQSLITEINSIRRQIEESLAFIEARKKEKTKIHAEYATTLARYRVLASRSKEKATTLDKDTVAASVLSVVNCDDAETCDQAWALSRVYAERYATTALEIVTGNIIMTAPPLRDRDLRITVSRSYEGEKNDRAAIFLDVQCRGTVKGQEFCRSKKVYQTKSNFRAYIESRLQPH